VSGSWIVVAQNRIGDKHKLTLMMLVGVLREVTATAILRVDILDVCLLPKLTQVVRISKSV